jgi:5-formaminoimidazole-4-carboxamide-1-(beta)-D-ribofuranosyl 5'-monophosphate synthetase
MVTASKISQILKGYDLKNIRVGSLGGHSALDICRGAKAEGLETVVVARADRAKTYSEYYKTRGTKGCVDYVIEVSDFNDITKPEIQAKLRDLNTIFVHSRYFWVYCDFKQIENNFNVPIMGNRLLVRKEERDEPKNQYYLLNQAGIRIPKRFSRPEDIDRLVIVKAAESTRAYERAFFIVGSHKEYLDTSNKLLKQKAVSEQSLSAAVIEEFVVGPQLNLNFFYSPLSRGLELMGTDIRRQTNIDGLLRLTASEQLSVLEHVRPQYIENGHQAVTIKESLIEKVFDAGEKFVSACAKYYPPGMIGPFALQGAVTAGPPQEEIVIFDVSMRIPGSPGTMFTPYSGYLYSENISIGRRIAMEIKQAAKLNRLTELTT